MKLTKRVVDELAPPVPVPPATKTQVFYRDDLLPGFALRLTSGGVKTFVVEKRSNGRLRRVSIGRYGVLTVEQARKEAQKLLGQIATGVDPAAEWTVQPAPAGMQEGRETAVFQIKRGEAAPLPWEFCQ